MKHWKPLFTVVAIIAVVVVMIPTLMVIPFSNQEKGEEQRLKEPKTQATKSPKKETAKESSVNIKVYRDRTQKVESVPLEEYVAGVVAAEMPADFELEALKAQALTARTYIVKVLQTKAGSQLPGGANVTDTVNHQVYHSSAELKTQWGKNYNAKMGKIKQAVALTTGQLLTYEGSPITASFFSTSNGYTENSEDYWPNALPYLRSVKSPWDKNSPKFKDETTISVNEFERLLNVKLGSKSDIGQILSRTKGKRIGELVINGKRLTGKKVRENLNLKSSDFTWYRKGNKIVITTKGFGHGVGMSQYGANGMALDGKTYKDIVKHYYKGVSISNVTAFLPTYTASK